MYTIPPRRVTGASAALVVGANVVNVLPAPGAGNAIRIVGGVISINRLATGIVDYTLSDGTTFWRCSGCSIAGTPWAQVDIPPPGYQMGVNAPLTLDFASSAATGNGIYTIYYYVDPQT